MSLALYSMLVGFATIVIGVSALGVITWIFSLSPYPRVDVFGFALGCFAGALALLILFYFTVAQRL